MFLIVTAKLKNIILIKKTINSKEKAKHYFYSDFTESVLPFILNKQCYFIYKKNKFIGIIFINHVLKKFYFVPAKDKNISFTKLLFLLKSKFNLPEYSLNLLYKDIEPEKPCKYFNAKILNDVKLMYISTNKFQKINVDKDIKCFEKLDFRNLKINEEEQIRVDLQNEIFSDVEGRRELTIKEVFAEEKEESFLCDKCFLLEFEKEAIGYAQIIKLNNAYYLVNFGIKTNYRKNGYGKIFLYKILEQCSKSGIDDLFLTVENSNYKAIKLYRKIGFIELNNFLSIKI
ncbi:hypothetical protein Q428_14605 [Fervidicella metallireducens AeB]|uniref:N-acetyltransferase domain-containing protein n=1 Tax=Fervidicella metallireducens AeB TaxID=1403537 RepID=A0A017RRW9_9CLOT|nr:GNAT family N-acetyltransferase [Fervidicella metallireducens]EYE87204.1 hypothetical protein Q428_14605 [Fervidicella metallireducens AeB]